MKKTALFTEKQWRDDRSTGNIAGRSGHRMAIYFLPVFLFLTVFSNAQCPPNLGFETGGFDSWQCLAGNISAEGKISMAPTTPLPNRHTIYRKGTKDLDKFGKFPVVCPNSSNYSIRLGNDSIGAQVDGVSYTFTVPAGVDDYSIIYNYAVVFQNPDHADFQQPRFTAKVFDVSANSYIKCSSFDYTSSSNLPGFKRSSAISDNLAAVYYKPWSAVSIKLLGYAGKTLRLEFVVNDCTLSAHFGYAYFDVMEDCGTLIRGNILCNGATSTVLTAPYGFQSYRWYNSNFSQVLGNDNILRLNPLPAFGTQYALELIPFPGSGCQDTIYTAIKPGPVPFVFKIADTTGACKPNTVDITAPSLTAGSTAGLAFSYFADSNMLQFAEDVDHITDPGKFYVRASNTAGCLDMRPLAVKFDAAPDVTFTDPKPVFYPDVVDITSTSLITGIKPGMTFSYWRNPEATLPLANPKAIETGGLYYIQSRTQFGCTEMDPVNVVVLLRTPPNIFTPNGDGINDLWMIPSLARYPQCEVSVFNRAGRLVFKSTGYTKPWDGKLNGKPLPAGTYFYVIKGTDNLTPISGSVTIIY